ncbi:MAG: multiheme c-type cytochrome [Pseudomonadota bacterium]|nr:multiheme c-type cytochrome [Pseudomonadota bacterium]
MTPRRWGLVVALLCVAAAAPAPQVSALFSRGLAPVDLGATPDADRTAAACATCHADISAEWARSRHHLAWTNGIFQREYRRQPLDWCVRCHAPLATGGAASVGPVEAEGVSCAVCHVRDGRMVAARAREGSPHDTVAVAGFDSAALCEGCHQFAFPVVNEDSTVTRYTEHPMQDTVAEFRAGAHAGTPRECLGCHGNTPAGHRFPGGHDLAAVQHAAALDVCAARPGELRLRVTNVGAGHNLPTGDLHRHFQVRAWRSTAPTALFEAFIGRAFEPAPDAGKQVRVDTSIPPLQSATWEVKLRALGGAADEPVNVELRYVYTADEEPTARNAPGEPTYLVVHEQRVDPAKVPACPR